MRLLIFGATGNLGRELVTQALEQHHTVTAFVRNPAAIILPHERLEVIKGDVLEIASIEKAVPGHEAVLLALGVRTMKKNSVVSSGSKNIIQSMQKEKIKRLISVSSLGLGSSRGQFGYLFETLVFRGVARAVFGDLETQEGYIQQSNLDWTIVRAGRFIKGTRTSAYRSGFIKDPAAKNQISPADVAEFMLQQVTDKTYIYQTPGISY